MAESRLESWWETVVIPAIVGEEMHRLNRQMVEASAVELDGAMLHVRGGPEPLASPAVRALVVDMVKRWPPPAPLRVTSVAFADLEGVVTYLDGRRGGR